MTVPRLIQTVDTLTKSEWTSLRKYILMRTSEKSDPWKLFQLLQKRKHTENKLFDIERIRESHFSNLTSKGILNVMSRLNVLLEDWIVVYDLDKDQEAKELMLIQSLNRRGLYSLANHKARKLEKDLTNNDSWDHTTSSKLQRLYHVQYYSDNPIKYKEGDILLKKLVHYHMLRYNETSLLYISELCNWGRIRDIDYSKEITKLKQSIPTLDYSSYSKSLSLLYEMIAHDNVDALYSLKESVLCGKFRKGTEIHTIIVLYLIEFARKFWIKGQLHDKNLLFDLYDYGFTSKALFNGPKIPRLRFHNVIATLGSLENVLLFEHIEEFIEKWVVHVDTENIQATRALSLAQNCFSNKKYHLIRNHLIGFDFGKDQHRALRLELIGLYYERKQYYELLENRIFNAKRHFQRNKANFTKKFFSANINLIKVIEKLIKNDFKKVPIDTNGYTYLNHRKWIEKEIKKRNIPSAFPLKN